MDSAAFSEIENMEREEIIEEEIRRKRAVLARQHQLQREKGALRGKSSGQRSAPLKYRTRAVEAEYEEEHPETGCDRNPGRRGSRARESRPLPAKVPAGHREKRRTGRGRRGRKKKRIVLPLLFLLLLLVFAWQILPGFFRKKIWTVVVFGLDERGGGLEKGAQSDVIMLASINRKTGEVKLVSVYRDTYTKINPEGDYFKINEAYFLGGHKQAIAALERTLDLQIDDYVSFNWAAVATGINGLGGVDLEISKAEFKYINAFITETVKSTKIGSVQLKSAGQNHLDGVQAVAYGRLRLMDTDFQRTARQRRVLSLVMEKAKKTNPLTLGKIASEVYPMISTSMNLADMVSISGSIGKFSIADAQGFPFTKTTRKIRKMDCVIPATLESNVTELHEYLYGDKNYTPSPEVKEISAHVAEVSGVKKILAFP